MRVQGISGELYFHILRNGRKLANGDYRVVEVGKEMKASRKAYLSYNWVPAPEKPTLCYFGMHASSNFTDASGYRNPFIGSWVCIVRLSQDVQHDKDKSVAMRRTVVAMREVRTAKQESKLLDYNISNEEVYKWVMRKENL